MEITDTNTNTSNRVMRSYRVEDGHAKLYITADRKIWYATGDDAPGFSHVGTLASNSKISRTNVCHIANCW